MSGTDRARPTLGYLGWIGFGNMGDEAIHEALVGALPTVELLPLPLGMRATVRSAGQLRAFRRAAVLLGGGTVVGRRIWRAHMAQSLVLTGGGPALMIGAGVEDPSFTRRRWLSETNELRRWKQLLARFPKVTVRGPRSARLLADIGVDAEVVGDPALLIDTAIPAAPTQDDLIGINLGASDDLWGHDQGAVVTEVAGAVAELAERGWRFRCLVVNRDDAKHASRCGQLAGLGNDGWDVVSADRPQAFLRAVAPCRLVVAERLHAAVLASRLGIPTVSLAYQPKCLDFAESVGADDLAIRTDQLQHGALVDLVDGALGHEVERRRELTTRVDDLRVRLLTEASSLLAGRWSSAAGWST